MSRTDWERGTITLPSNQWAAFRKGLLSKWNAKQDEVFADANRAHAAITAAAKGKRGAARQKAMTDALYRHTRTEVGCYTERHENLSRLVFKREGWSGPVTLQKPKRKDLDLKAISKDASITCGEAYVGFRNKGRTVHYDSGENNHAVEHAREHWFVQALFTALGKVTWTRGSGGELHGNDEYNIDSGRDYAGGGGSYVTATYSKAQQEADRKARQSYRSPSYGYGSYGGYAGRRF